MLNAYFLSVTAAARARLCMHVSGRRAGSVIAVDFISPHLISSGVFPSRLQIDPASFQEGRRPIKRSGPEWPHADPAHVPELSGVGF